MTECSKVTTLYIRTLQKVPSWTPREGTTASLSAKAWPLACTPMNIMAGFTQERLVTVNWHQPWYSGRMWQVNDKARIVSLCHTVDQMHWEFATNKSQYIWKSFQQLSIIPIWVKYCLFQSHVQQKKWREGINSKAKCITDEKVLHELRVRESEKNEQKEQKGKHGVTRQKKQMDKWRAPVCEQLEKLTLS